MNRQSITYRNNYWDYLAADSKQTIESLRKELFDEYQIQKNYKLHYSDFNEYLVSYIYEHMYGLKEN